MIKEVADHYWLGSKLLWSDIKVAKDILSRVFEGHSMTRRERIQLIRTSTDIFRLVPFSVFVIVPFMELLLPFALKLFPNMLPSTFQDSLKAEESMKKELQMRLAVAKFMQESLEQMAEKKKSSKSTGSDQDASGAQEVIDFVEKARQGEPIPKESVMRIAKLFQDELTLANVGRPQLVSMCQYMGLQAYGADSFMRFQLRNKLRMLQDDDRRILWEGIDSLNTLELRDACRERGMRSIGMTQFKLKSQLQEWLDLSTQKGIPIFLLIMSRAFMLSSAGSGGAAAAAAASGGQQPHHTVASAKASDPEQVLKTSMSFLDSDTINEVVLNAAKEEEDSNDMRRRRLESIQFQKERMQEERLEQAGATQQQHQQQLLKAEEVVGDRAAVAASASTTVTSSTAARPSAGDSQVASVPVTAITQLPPHDLAPVQPEPLQIVPAKGAVTGESAAAVRESEPAAKEDKAKQELTVHELVTLSDLASKSSVRREISELAVLEAFIESLPIPTANRKTAAAAAATATTTEHTAAPDSSKHKVAEVEEDEPEDKSVTRMKSVISAMVNKLKVKIDSTEKVLSDKLRVLDRDDDGEISYDDVKEFIGKVMKQNSSTEESVVQLFSLLDSNKDGKVSVAELLHYIHKKKESMEEEKLKAQMEAAAAAAAAEKDKEKALKGQQQQLHQNPKPQAAQDASLPNSSVESSKPTAGPK
uniref:Mitochondrial proton/calcium exchanger protein n=1 Tax=Spumella elongata TaxID=89044 RepID=A0A7S3GSB9_9STRA